MSSIESAWSEYRSQLLAFIQSKVKARDDAEDILNDVFEKLLKQSVDDNMPDNIVAWLYRVARNSIVDYYRTRKSSEHFSKDMIDEQPNPAIIDQLAGCVLPMIQTLPDFYRQVLLLVDIEGRKQKEVAAYLGLSLAALKSRILRGRAKLSGIMHRCCTIEQDSRGTVISVNQKPSAACSGCE
ncbi:sigma-70 family RNA polymerase sigma factor [Kaarinaea lacus]